MHKIHIYYQVADAHDFLTSFLEEEFCPHVWAVSSVLLKLPVFETGMYWHISMRKLTPYKEYTNQLLLGDE